MRRATQFLAAGLAVLSVGTAGCGSDSGSSAAADGTPTVDLSTLDVGSYQTKPREIVKSNLNRARLSEGQRLGNYLPLASDVDPKFKFQSGTAALAVFGFLDPVPAMGKSASNFDSDAKQFTAGFYTIGRSESDLLIATTLSNAVLLFPDEKSSSDAAEALYRTDLSRDETHTSVSVENHPSTRAFWKPGNQQITSYQATGRFVIFTRVTDYAKIEVKTSDLPALTSLVAKSIDTIEPELRQFRPTDPDKLADLELDHEGMLARSLPRPDEDKGTAPGIYNGHGALHLSNNPERDRKLYPEAGVDWVTHNAGLLYRAKDSKSAQLIRDQHGALLKTSKRVESPKNIPDARCREFKVTSMFETRYSCIVAYDRYTFETFSNQLTDAHQRISAQYTILVNANNK